MKVVSNSGPLIALARLGRLGLLNQLYDAVLMPPEVYQEVVVNGLRLGAPDADAVQFLVQQEHIQVAPLDLAVDDSLMVLGIDVGEAEAIALSRREGADWVLIDNEHARRAARHLGIPCKGTIGILIEAFRKHLLTLNDFELLMHEIKHQPALWISERLCDEALAQVRRESRRPSRD